MDHELILAQLEEDSMVARAGIPHENDFPSKEHEFFCRTLYFGTLWHFFRNNPISRSRGIFWGFSPLAGKKWGMF